MFSAMTSVNKLPGAFPSVHRRARERPTGSEFLTARTRLRVSDCNEVVANCISWGPRHFPSLLPDCSSSLACFWNRMPVTSEWGPGVASPPTTWCWPRLPQHPSPSTQLGTVVPWRRCWHRGCRFTLRGWKHSYSKMCSSPADTPCN